MKSSSLKTTFAELQLLIGIQDSFSDCVAWFVGVSLA